MTLLILTANTTCCSLPPSCCGTEEQLLQRQVRVTCLRSTATAAEVTTEFSRYGSVQQVQLQFFGLNGASASSLNDSRGKQKPPPMPRAVVEFTDAAGAAAALAARRQVAIFTGRNGVRSSSSQLVLPAAGIGHLKNPCECRRYRRPCACPGYVKWVTALYDLLSAAALCRFSRLSSVAVLVTPLVCQVRLQLSRLCKHPKALHPTWPEEQAA
jgi:hypothetical protein